MLGCSCGASVACVETSGEGGCEILVWKILDPHFPNSEVLNSSTILIMTRLGLHMDG